MSENKINQRSKLIALLITAVILAAGGGVVYYIVSPKEETAVDDAAAEAMASGNAEDQLILLEGGEATIGSPEDERQRQADETRHQVTLSPFYLDPFEVTQADYTALMGENPSHFQGDDLPVDSVTWYDAVAYCNALSEARGLTPVYTIDGTRVIWDRSADGYRLPTEAEWEYAARAGSETVFWRR
ncbi:MAG: formylglycine-generating enzyme family protein [Eubacterium sp.]|nr:formylglycine-generating enzyme family protein [Eubacterium sp.]